MLLLYKTLAWNLMWSSGRPTKGFLYVPGVSAALAARGVSSSFAYNRKEAKDHGEGGDISWSWRQRSEGACWWTASSPPVLR